jgi:lipopolysaccharide export LptBFGC system permease protein LptF
MSLDFKSNTYIGRLIKVMGVGLFFFFLVFFFKTISINNYLILIWVLLFILVFFNICLLYSQINILAFSWYSILQTYSFSTI